MMARHFTTPSWPVHRLLDEVAGSLPPDSTWIDPCVGGGGVVRAVIDWYAVRSDFRLTWQTNDTIFTEVDFGLSDGKTNKGRAQAWLPTLATETICIVDPPKEESRDILRAATAVCGVVMALLPIVWICRQARFCSGSRPDVWVLPDPLPRREGRGPMEDACWLVWRRGKEGGRVRWLAATPSEARQKQRPRPVGNGRAPLFGE